MNDSSLQSGWKPVNKSSHSPGPAPGDNGVPHRNKGWTPVNKSGKGADGGGGRGFGVSQSNVSKGWTPVNKSGKEINNFNLDKKSRIDRFEDATLSKLDKPNTQGKKLNDPVSGSGWKSIHDDSSTSKSSKYNKWTIHNGNKDDIFDGITLSDDSRVGDGESSHNINSPDSSEIDYDIRACIPPNLGWLTKKLNPAEMKYCWDCIKRSEESVNLNNEDDNYNKILVGNVSKSRKLEDKDRIFMTRTILPLLQAYGSSFNMKPLRPTKNNILPKKGFVLSDWWVNYQKKHEFNPLHDHNGMFSFVIWMKIPTNSKDQQKLKISAENSEDPKSISNFRITYTNILGQLSNYTYEQNPDQEGVLLFFPSELNHQVFPFYDCEEDRISISGNIKVE